MEEVEIVLEPGGGSSSVFVSVVLCFCREHLCRRHHPKHSNSCSCSSILKRWRW